MQQKSEVPVFPFVARILFIWGVLLPVLSAFAADAPPAPVPDPEPELVIVKYGSIVVRSDEPGAKVYVDDIYKGGAASVIESVVAGDHTISCKAGDKTVSGSFVVKKNETLKLDANFGDGKLALFREPSREPVKVAVPDVVEKKKPEPVKVERPKKPVEPKKVEQKNPVEERRKNHLTLIKLDYELSDSQAVVVEQSVNQHAISKYSLNKNTTGKYYRTKQGLLLCEAEPCELTWSTKFIYTDENSKADALLVNWKETVFNGITPAGTSKQELECCLNGQCWKMQNNPKAAGAQEFEIGERYRLSWTQSSVLIRRTDIMNEILQAGRSLSDY